MNIDVMSDVHLEFNPDGFPLKKLFEKPGERSHTLVIAGDICPLREEKETIQKTRDFFALARDLYKNVVFVLGNHDYWGSSFKEAVQTWTDIAGVAPLQNKAVEIDGFVFAGTTLWTEPSKENFYPIETGMCDYYMIQGQDDIYPFIRIKDTIREHRKALSFLKRTVKINQKKPIVVVSHHAPLYPPQGLVRNGLEAAYANQLDELLSSSPTIQYWIHGHIHGALPYEKTNEKHILRVLANPRGCYGLEQHAQSWTLKTFKL